MGWEIHFNSYDKNKDGRGYDMDNPTAFKKQIGKMDDIPLEKVVGEIVKQMARRDVLVEVDKIFEFTKKQVSFREAKGAVVIKGQKFNLDGMPVEAIQETEVQPQQQAYAPTNLVIPTSNDMQSLGINQENAGTPMRSLRERLGMTNPEASVVIENPNQQSQFSQPLGAEAANLRILRMESFDPDDHEVVIQRLSAKGMSFTLGKKYPVFKEFPKEVTTKSQDRGVETNVLLIYKVSDDNNKLVDLPSTYFRVPTPGLTFMGPQQQQAQKAKQQYQPKLLYMGNGANYGGGGQINVGSDNGQMINIRRGV